MPLYSVDVEKLLGSEYWSNRYIVNAASLAAANSVGAQIATIEQNVHSSEVTITKLRTSDQVMGTDEFIVTPLNNIGLAAAGVSRLPLFCVARVDFSVGAGRPSRKYLRLPIYEADVENETFTGAFQTRIANDYVTPLVNLVGYVDVDGQEVIMGQLFPKLAMRQLRRGSKRRLEPIIP